MTPPRKFWPAPESRLRLVPSRGSVGSFWKWRGDRHHCGVDLLAPVGSPVVAIEAGRVIQTGVFTSAKRNSYWNRTSFVLVRHHGGAVAKYAELGKALVRAGQRIEAGRRIGLVGQVLNAKRVNATSPSYIRRMIRQGCVSMLHFEIYDRPMNFGRLYSGGNWFGGRKPKSLRNPTRYLRSAF
jgi:murein DD-endopeptidase MepM/ murein hydrolase activator NlpD